VVAVEVAIDDITHRQVGDLIANLLDQYLRGRRFRVRIHDQDVIAIDHDRRVAVQHGGRPRDRAVDPLGDLLEVEEPGRGGADDTLIRTVVRERTDQRPPR
jgi:hypothetical protein